MGNYFNLLKECKKFEKSTVSQAHMGVSSLTKDNFLDVLLKGNYRYKVKVSCGMGSKSDMWWFGVFDRNYYEWCFNITDQRKVGASLGYYIVYLFNDKKTKVYLSLNQAAKGVNSSPDRTLVMNKVNEQIRKELHIKQGQYLLNLNGKLTTVSKESKLNNHKKNNNNARDYEIGSIIALEYDLLSNNINDSTIESDFSNMIKYYDKLVGHIKNSRFTYTDNLIFDMQKQLAIHYNANQRSLIENNDDYMQEKQDVLDVADEQITDDEVDEIDNSQPDYEENKNDRVKTNKKLAKVVLIRKNYRCEVNNEHGSFINKKNKPYMEVHHLIPVKYQKDYANYRLDRSANLVCLCSECHNAIHYGNFKEQISRLSVLYEKSDMKDFLKQHKINNFAEFYEKFY